MDDSLVRGVSLMFKSVLAVVVVVVKVFIVRRSALESWSTRRLLASAVGIAAQKSTRLMMRRGYTMDSTGTSFVADLRSAVKCMITVFRTTVDVPRGMS